jgi:protein-S-isoprenylcysteine O-methyltransferase Ste14
MAQLAIGGLVLYLAVALGLRMLIQWRLTGSTGFQAINGKAGSLDGLPECFRPLRFSSAVSLVLVLSGIIPTLSILVSPAVQSTGLVVFALGLSMTFAAQLGMGQSWRIGVKPGKRRSWSQRVCSPYCGIAPTALAAGSWMLLLVAVELQVRFVEEPHLLRVHGNACSKYASRVGRFLPGLGWL